MAGGRVRIEGRIMVDAPTRRQIPRLERVAFHEAGHAVVAASFGCRFGMLTLYPDMDAESAVTGPLQIDLWKCAFPAGQPDRLLQVLTMLWAGTAAEVQFMGRRVAPEADPDRKTVGGFIGHLRERGVTIPDEWDRRPRLNAHALFRQPKQGAAVDALATRLLDAHVIGHFTARGIINDAMGTATSRFSRRGAAEA
jgi:hypothetical protein